ncbi:hypothetical protein ABTF71_19515, partial [Acinetobacter baumannii]
MAVHPSPFPSKPAAIIHLGNLTIFMMGAQHAGQQPRDADSVSTPGRKSHPVRQRCMEAASVLRLTGSTCTNPPRGLSM